MALMMLISFAAAEGGDVPETPGMLAGGWAAAENHEVTEEIEQLVEKGLEGMVGVSYLPVAYLGSQVVAGTNHAVLCYSTVVYPGAVPEWKILYLYEDLQGNVSILNIADFDFGALCYYGGEDLPEDAKRFEGTYVCDRCEIEIGWDGVAQYYSILIHWADGALVSNDWIFNAVYDAERDGLDGTGMASRTEYKEDSDIPEVTDLTENGCEGFFSFNEDGKLIWTGTEGADTEGMEFERAENG